MNDSIDTTIATPGVKTARAQATSTDGFLHQGLPILVPGEQEPTGSLGNISTVASTFAKKSRNKSYKQHFDLKSMMSVYDAHLKALIPSVPPGDLGRLHGITGALKLMRSSVRYCGDRLIPAKVKRKDGTIYDTGAPGHAEIHTGYSDKSLAHYAFVKRCGNVWACRGCATKIYKKRRDELQQAFDYFKAEGNKMYSFVTLTYPHTIDQDLTTSMVTLGQAIKSFTSGRASKDFRAKFGQVHTIRATEVTYGASGWHPHYHLLLVYDRPSFSQTDIESIESYIKNRWHNICLKSGLIKNEIKAKQHLKYGVKVITSAEPVNWDYMAKIKVWEMASTTSKTARNSEGLSPWEIFDLAQAGDKKYQALWWDYMQAMRGRAAIRWSPGLKVLVGVDDKTDEELSQGKTAKLLYTLPREGFNRVVRRRAHLEILEAVELALAGGDCDELEAVYFEYGLIYAGI